jgi:iron complex outermembrane recepter protein
LNLTNQLLRASCYFDFKQRAACSTNQFNHYEEIHMTVDRNKSRRSGDTADKSRRSGDTANRTLSLAVRAALALALLPTYVAAQDEVTSGVDEATDLDTVVVTARKREEELRDVPLSITALTAENIDKLGLESINDIAKVSPAFSFRSQFNREGDRPVIRGQSNIQGESNAAFFIDGVFVSGNISGYGLDNLARVEVIRGPQSALFGRRTFSGAVNFITKRPTNDPKASLSLTAATDSERELSANASGALVDDLLMFQFNTRYYQFGGQWENANTGIKDLGGQRTASIGTTFYLTPTDWWESTLRMNYTDDEDEAYAAGRIGDPANLLARGITATDTASFVNNVLNCQRPTFTGANTTGILAGVSPISSTRSRGGICGTAPYPTVIGANTERFTAAGFKPGLDRQRTRFSLSNDFTSEGGWVFSTISAYNKSESLSVVDQDYSSPAIFAFPFSAAGAFETVDFGITKDYSQEFRLASPTDGPVRGLVGFYYYDENSGGAGGFSADMTTFRPATATNAAVLPTIRPSTSRTKTTNTALFGMLDYDITDAFTVTGELRLAQDRIDASGTSNSSINPTGTPAATRISRTFNRRANYDNILPRLTVKYDLNDSMNVYALAAKGNKPGGFNLGVESADLTEAARGSLITQGFDVFDEESATTVELGFKAGFMDDAISFSSALFNINWENQQLTETAAADRINGTQTLTSYTRSIGESRVRGLELEGDWRLSDNFTANASYARLDAEIRDYYSQDVADVQNCGAVNRLTGCGSAAGNDLPRVPKNKGSVGGRWDATLGNGVGYFVSAQMSYEGSRFAQIENNIETGSCKDLGLRGGVMVDNLTATLFVRNATNSECIEDVLRYINPQFGIATPSIPGGASSAVLVSPGSGLTRTNPRDYVVTPGRERQVGITVNYRF